MFNKFNHSSYEGMANQQSTWQRFAGHQVTMNTLLCGDNSLQITTMSILNFVWHPFLDFGSEKPFFPQSRRQNPTKLACTNGNGKLLGELELWKRGQ